jgi:hypothetical protein
MPLQPPKSPAKDPAGFVPPPGTGIMPGIAALTTGSGKPVQVSSPSVAKARCLLKEKSPSTPTGEADHLDPFATVRACDSPRATRSDVPRAQATTHEPPAPESEEAAAQKRRRR